MATIIRIRKMLPSRFSYYLAYQRRSFAISLESVYAHRLRVRFAASPTGSLHLCDARTALFNYLYARKHGGKFVVRIEDTGSTRESEEAMLKDLSWLGLDWDEGPEIGGDYGPYRQSERNDLYKKYADKLLASGHVYRCFCSNKELEKIKEIAKLEHLPPVYRGKWASATDEEVQEELEKGTPFTYRFRVPKGESLKIDDYIKGEVSWNLDLLGDFVIMRNNGQPVHNFCVAVDDATMAISHVIRSEDHLPNTVKEALIHKALGFPMPNFVHVSSILAPDGSKLSKWHGATSVGQFREIGYLPEAVVNYLAKLGWGCKQVYGVLPLDLLARFFSLSVLKKGRISPKSTAIFDLTKLRWMNGLLLKEMLPEELTKLIGEHWKISGILKDSKGPFVEDAVRLLEDEIDLIADSDKVLSNFLSYPLEATLMSPEGKALMEDKLSEVSSVLLAAYESGELTDAVEEGPSGWQEWVNNFKKSLKRKDKSLFLSLRVLLTGKLHGPDIASSVQLLYKTCTCNIVSPNFGFVTLSERFENLRLIDWEKFNAREAEVLIWGGTTRGVALATATCGHEINPSAVLPLIRWKPSTRSSFARQIAVRNR